MGFLDALRKIFMGQPVFTAQQGGNRSSAASQGPKVLPQVIVERWQVVPKGAGLHLEILIQNHSQAGVVLQKIELLGLVDELGNHLNAGETYEFVADLPNRPKDINQHECKLFFHNDAGDYFLALHQIEFDKLPDGTFTIRNIKLLPPIRDV